MFSWQVTRLEDYVNKRYAEGLIDSPENLRSTPILLFNGHKDWTVWTNEMRAAASQLDHFSSNVRRVFNTSAKHVWSIDHGPCECGKKTSLPRCGDVENCAYDLSGDLLRMFYGEDAIKPRTRAHRKLYWIPQRAYLPSLSPNARVDGIAKYMLAYVPRGCEAEPRSCRIHINFHGCISRDWELRRRWATDIDLNEYAEANDIVILYPQAAGSKRAGVGCWNWGFPNDDKYFDARKSLQIRTVVNVIDSIDSALKRAVVIENDAPAPEWTTLDDVTIIKND